MRFLTDGKRHLICVPYIVQQTEKKPDTNFNQEYLYQFGIIPAQLVLALGRVY